eukprot:CAMPEP_0115847660 /NCGR_PEP_ID=MMETSP0287-20121206/10499_1 /TAXON_ID=412157 /ORGANISM="Chrysochromulina rotalis, Strain UIO044" /LENGTH=65 /DNA_ID=CAMNT_0003301505 /DNA_START=228 /DNA_END=425 /DNA_ORIENTATION=+
MQGGTQNAAASCIVEKCSLRSRGQTVEASIAKSTGIMSSAHRASRSTGPAVEKTEDIDVRGSRWR